MSEKLTILDAVNQGLIRKRSKVIMPVDFSREVRMPECLTGKGDEIKLKLELKYFSSSVNPDRCLCIVLEKPKDGYLLLAGEHMPNPVVLRGNIGVTRVRACLDVIADSQFGYERLGIAAQCMTLDEEKRWKRRNLLPKPERPWGGDHWLPERISWVDSDDDYFCKFGVKRMSESEGVRNHCYLGNSVGCAAEITRRTRPLFFVPIYNSQITVEVDEFHDGRSEKTAFVFQGPGMPKIF